MTRSANYALSMLRRADGGAVTGPLLGSDPGRTDTRPISVPANSFVFPADVVSGMPGAQGNSLAGHAALTKLMESLPLLPDEAPYGASLHKLKTTRTMPGIVSEHRLMEKGLASGGRAEDHEHEHVPILAADGEFIADPKYVRRAGQGSHKLGHDIFDLFCKEVRKRNIRDLKKLPGTVKD